jgi:hypothetical protein
VTVPAFEWGNTGQSLVRLSGPWSESRTQKLPNTLHVHWTEGANNSEITSISPARHWYFIFLPIKYKTCSLEIIKIYFNWFANISFVIYVLFTVRRLDMQAIPKARKYEKAKQFDAVKNSCSIIMSDFILNNTLHVSQAHKRLTFRCEKT